MAETNREFLHGDVTFNFEHYQVEYRCTACGHERQQEEHIEAASQCLAENWRKGSG